MHTPGIARLTSSLRRACLNVHTHAQNHFVKMWMVMVMASLQVTSNRITTVRPTPNPSQAPLNMLKPTQTQPKPTPNPPRALLNMVKPTQTQPKPKPTLVESTVWVDSFCVARASAQKPFFAECLAGYARNSQLMRRTLYIYVCLSCVLGFDYSCSFLFWETRCFLHRSSWYRTYPSPDVF